MNKEEIKQLKGHIENFKGKDLYIEIQNAINFHINIENASIIVSNEKLFISNEEQKDFIIELHYLDSITAQNSTIYLEMDNDINIIISY